MYRPSRARHQRFKQILHTSRKVNKKLSFFNVRDSSGSVQLVVSANASTDVLSSMREVPTESTILVEGIVRMRGLSHRREVSHHFNLILALVSLVCLYPYSETCNLSVPWRRHRDNSGFLYAP